MADVPAMPDFAAMAQSHQTLSSELGKFQNLPAVDNGLAIIQAINNLAARFDTRLDAMDTRLDTMDARIDARLNLMNERIDARFNSMDERIDARFNSMELRFKAMLVQSSLFFLSTC